MNETQDVSAAVREVINRVLSDSGRASQDWQDDDVLTRTIGLDSLDLAVMVVGLEDRLGVDPFRSGASPVQTVGELVTVYEQAVKS